jgi:hypothetical protein
LKFQTFRNYRLPAIGHNVLVLSVVVSLALCFASAYALETPDENEARLTAQLVAPSELSANYKGNESAKVALIEFGDYQCISGSDLTPTRRISL